MGDAKRKSLRPVLTEKERAEMLGSNPFEQTYDILYRMIEKVYTTTGSVSHELVGVEFVAGSPSRLDVVSVRHKEDAPFLREQMLKTWPMVVHIFEAWAAPDASAPASKHPLRFDIVSVMLNTSDAAVSATCRVDPSTRTIERGELLRLSGLGGRFGRDLPTRH